MDESFQDWTHDDFLALLTIYGAHADMEVSDDEKTWICQQFGEDHYQKANATYERLSDYDVIQAIMQMKERFFPGEQGKLTLRAMLERVFAVNHQFSTLEDIVLKGLDKVL